MPRNILTGEQAVEIYSRKRRRTEEYEDLSFVKSATAVALEYRISPKAVRDIWNRRSWTRETRHLWSKGEVEFIRKTKLSESKPAYPLISLASSYCPASPHCLENTQPTSDIVAAQKSIFDTIDFSSTIPAHNPICPGHQFYRCIIFEQNQNDFPSPLRQAPFWMPLRLSDRAEPCIKRNPVLQHSCPLGRPFQRAPTAFQRAPNEPLQLFNEPLARPPPSLPPLFLLLPSCPPCDRAVDFAAAMHEIDSRVSSQSSALSPRRPTPPSNADFAAAIALAASTSPAVPLGAFRPNW
jgi:hypothetical protein